MPERSFPGVYVQEVPSGVRAVTAAPTSVTAFVGRARRGPVASSAPGSASAAAPVRVRSWAEYEREFGGLWEASPMSFAVQQFFLQGGREALVVRVVAGSTLATATFKDGTFGLAASSPGSWGDSVEFAVDYSDGMGGTLATPLFNVSVRHLPSGQHEGFARLSTTTTDPRFVTTVLQESSALLRTTHVPVAPAARPAERGFTALHVPAGADGGPVGAAEITHPSLAATQRGMFALDRADGFNLLVIPPYDVGVDVAAADYAQAAQFCASSGAMLLVDAPAPVGSSTRVAARATAPLDAARWSRQAAQFAVQFAVQFAGQVGAQPNVACFAPHLLLRNPLAGGRVDAFAPSGAVAGLIARTDAVRGVWKAPAGAEATLRGVEGTSLPFSHADNGVLNAAGVNAIRSFDRYGTVVWGARTLAGGASSDSEWRYLSVRRLALFIEASVRGSSAWVVFEPNDEPLWAQLGTSVDAFLNGLFRQGAFQGASPREAYFVKCGRDTTTSVDIARGLVNVQIGFAPLKPAEFVVVRITLGTGRA